MVDASFSAGLSISRIELKLLIVFDFTVLVNIALHSLNNAFTEQTLGPEQ